MTLAEAESYLHAQFARIDALFLRKLFDEWAILGVGTADTQLVSYRGPRADTYRARLAEDTRPLRTAMAQRDYHVGDFEFALDAEGTGYDACVKIGNASYLICNNLAATMEELRRDPQWLKVQPLWFELCEKFRTDPLV